MHRTRRLFALALLACSACAGLVGASAAGAASIPDPCKILKIGQITDAFGAKPSGVNRLAREISSTSCSYAIPAATGHPDGELIVTITFANAKPTYNGVARDARYTPLTDSGFDGMYAPNPLSIVQVLKGSQMLGVQGVFFDATARPVVAVDVKDQLVALAKLGAKRV